ncbi:hypothetical protein SAMN05216389_103269 [Oceanobacillus limi]|uniref:Uncharacterized protein n=1 Tax=Oceanobacillus limi TaxID=930131 RepID=A0A1I0AIN1_9BACI|nr:hypothetical protein [Oceanobacillus limi]SES94157.1 hypothetical protein SAMN05216389_103269 [Oceanobacillus limi]
MNDVTMYYEYIHDEKVPVWFVVENIDWSNPSLYLNLKSYSQRDISYFQNDDIKVSVLLSDLILNHIQENHFGINLINIESGINDYGYDKRHIKALVIRVVDVKEVIYMDRVLV